MHRELERLKAIEQAATEGPWYKVTSRDVYSAVIAPGVATIAMDFERDEDADFVSEARIALPKLIALLAEIEAWSKSGTYGIVREQVERIITKHLGAGE